MKPGDEQHKINLTKLLELDSFSSEIQELGLREWRIRGIDVVINQIKKQVSKEDATAINRYLRMCPSIECLTEHLQKEYPEFNQAISEYKPKLHKKLK